MPYGYEPAQYRPSFGFIGEAAGKVGSAIDTGIAEYETSSYNKQLYSEAVQHAQSIGDVGKQIGFTPETVPKPAPSQNPTEYQRIMTNYAHEMMIKAYEAKVHQQVLDSSKSLAQGVTDTTSGFPQLKSDLTTSAQQGTDVAAEREQAAIAARGGPGVGVRAPEGFEVDRTSTPQLSPEAQADVGSTPQQMADKYTPPARSVSSTQFAAAAAATGAAGGPGIKETQESLEKSEGLESKVQTAAMERTSKEKIANQGNETKILIEGMKTKVAERKNSLYERAIGIQSQKMSDEKRKSLADLLVKIATVKASTAIGEIKLTGDPLVDKDAFAPITAANQNLDDLEKQLTEVEKIKDTDFGKAEKKVKGAKAGSTPQPKTKAEYNAIPSGTLYVDTDGLTKRKK